MKRIRRALAIVAGALLVSAAPAAAQAPCDPFGPATFRGEVPTPKQVIGIDLGERDVTTAESDAYATARGAGDRTPGPAILWIAGNVHGDEESGTDASLRVLTRAMATRCR